MAEDTDLQGTDPKDNELIRSFRAEIKELKAELKTKEDTIRAEIKRESTAESLMPEGYKGLAPYFAKEVDGDLDAKAAATWLGAKGIQASPEPDPVEEEETDVASELEALTDLGAQVAAASTARGTDAFAEGLGAVEKGVEENRYQTLAEVTAALDKL